MCKGDTVHTWQIQSSNNGYYCTMPCPTVSKNYPDYWNFLSSFLVILVALMPQVCSFPLQSLTMAVNHSFGVNYMVYSEQLFLLHRSFTCVFIMTSEKSMKIFRYNGEDVCEMVAKKPWNISLHWSPVKAN